MVGELVKRRRGLLGLTQVELGRRAGLSQNYISKLEQGQVDLPQRGTLDALGGALETPVEEFYRAAGVLEDLHRDDPAPRQLALLSLGGDEEYDAEAVVAYVQSRPGRTFQRQLKEAREERTHAEYVEFCLSIFRAWESNSDLGIRGFRLGRSAGTDGR